MISLVLLFTWTPIFSTIGDAKELFSTHSNHRFAAATQQHTNHIEAVVFLPLITTGAPIYLRQEKPNHNPQIQKSGATEATYLPVVAASGTSYVPPNREQPDGPLHQEPPENRIGNSAPILFAPAPQAILVGNAIALSLNARDPDGNQITFRANGLPRGLAINESTGLIFGYATEPGDYTVTIYAYDGQGGQSQSSMFIHIWNSSLDDFLGEPIPTPVGGPNREPIITHPGDQTGTVNQLSTLAIGVTDPDGDLVTFTAERLPSGLIIDVATGEISGNPSTAGSYNVTIRAEDSYGASHQIGFTWLILPESSVNQAPNMLPINDQYVTVGDKIYQLVGASEPDGEELSFIAVGLPPALYIDKEKGLIAGNVASAGTYEVTITATDIHGSSSSVTELWTVSPPSAEDNENADLELNHPPDVTSMADSVLERGAPVYQTLQVDDRDGDPLLISATGLPPGLDIDPISGHISGSADEAGSYESIIHVDDGRGGIGQIESMWLIRDVDGGNIAPQIQNPGDQRHTIGDQVSLTIGATDANADPLIFRADGLPNGLTLQDKTLKGTLTNVGAFTVTLTVEDPWGSMAIAEFGWTVNPRPVINRQPVLSSPGAQSSTVNDDVFVSVGAYDPEGDVLNYMASNLPPGLAIDRNSGQITGKITGDGSYDVTLAVEDSEQGSTSVTITWLVNPFIPNNQSPNLSAPEPQLTTVGEPVDLVIVATDPDLEPLIYLEQGLPPGLTIISQTGQITGATSTVGSYEITLTILDPKGAQDTASFSWVVQDASLGSGELLLETWQGINGSTIGKLVEDGNYPRNPNRVERLPQFESVFNAGDSYGSRFRAYIHAPVTGDYLFWISGDEQAELWLSSDDKPENATPIAHATSWTDLRQWDKYPQQQSVHIQLHAGQKYYIEALHKESNGDDHLSVSWLIPGWQRQIIGGTYLSPYQPDVALGSATEQSSTAEVDNRLAAYNATDGNLATYSQSAHEPQPWWEVDLGAVYELSTLKLWSRLDCCPEELSNFRVLVSAVPLTLINGMATNANPSNEILHSGIVDGSVEIALNQPGRYIRIERMDAGILSIAEVTVQGIPPRGAINQRPVSSLSLAAVGEKEASEKSGRKVALRVSRTNAAGAAQISFNFMGDADLTKGSATIDDFEVLDEEGNKLSDSITLPPLVYERSIWVRAIADELVEVPETLTVQIQNDETQANPVGAASASVVAATQNEVVLSLVDDLAGFGNGSRLFVAPLAAEGTAQTTASGIATIRLSNDNSYGLVNVSYSGLTSVQTAAHIHYASPESGPVIFSIPLGQITDERWAVLAAHEATTDQAMLDALLSGRLYLNVHSGNYPDGEIRGTAFVATGSNEFRGPDPAPAYEQLTGADLRYDILRFLGQSTMGATPDMVAELESKVAFHNGDRIAAYDEWLAEQMSLQPPSMLELYEANYAMWADGLDAATREVALLSSYSRQSGFYEAWFTAAAYSKAQLRERVAYALSQIFVVSNLDESIGRQPWLGASYLDMLKSNSFAPYEDLLYDVSVHPAMGQYLSMLRNRATVYDEGGNPLSSPDENYAREIMQLFSIGLLELHPDGSYKLDSNGLPIETYALQDVSDLARVFTGWAYAKTLAALDSPTTVENTDFGFEGLNAYRPDVAAFTFYHPYLTTALKMFEDNGLAASALSYQRYHDIDEKTILGLKFVANRSGIDEMHTVSQLLSSHENAGVFIGYRLIQRLVTSNPSAGYVYRVALTYQTSNGDLGEVIRAILLDPEARNISSLTQSGVGRPKEYLYQYTTALRTLRATSQFTDTYSLTTLVDHGYPVNELALYENDARIVYTTQCTLDCNLTINQAPMRAPSVFNWSSPEYAPVGAISKAGLVMPEMEHATESVVVAFYNLLYDYLIGDGNAGYEPKYGLGSAWVTHRYPHEMADAYMLVMDTDNDDSISVADDTVEVPEKIREASAAVVDIADEYLCSGQLKANASGDPATDPREIIIDGVVNTHSFWDFSSNLAEWKHANQSSLSSGGYHWRAVDGNVDGYYPHRSVTQTQLEPNAWWQVNLEALGYIEKIRIWGRTHCCQDRLQDFYIFVSDSPFASTGLADTINQAGVTSIYVGPKVNLFKTFDVNRTGQYVRIQLAGTNHLNLAEVQVIGPGATPTVYQPAQAHYVRDERIKEALYLVGTAPQCLIQR